ncbi:HAD family hydrolase [Thermodesulfobacteriota bacterium]
MKTNKLSEYRCIVFDCDGVILDSNKIKTDAFRFVLQNEPNEIVEKFIEYHKTNGGISRYVKFEYFMKNLKPDNKPVMSAEKYVKAYSDRVKDQLINCSLIPGVRSILEIFNEMKIPCAVNSGGDQEEIREVFAERNLDHFFIEILGSPATKSENLGYLSHNSILSNPSLFIGDALSDYLNAQNYGMDFIFISGYSEWNAGIEFCTNHNIQYYHDFRQLIFNNYKTG